VYLGAIFKWNLHISWSFIALILKFSHPFTKDRSAALLMETISAVTSKSVVASIQNAKFLSFTCDGCTDFTGDEYESVYVRHASGGIVYDQGRTNVALLFSVRVEKPEFSPFSFH
jgi:predicted nucleic-acid-binding Zn-ribbon protein